MKWTTLRNMKCGIIIAVIILMISVVSVLEVSSESAPAQRYSDWSTPINLGPIVNSEFNDVAPAISKDGLSLYFTSTREPGGFGGDDIYVSQRDSIDEPWGPPVNLGPTINTVDNERDPAFSRDGHLMFFVTDRPGGLGHRDIWVSRRVHKDNDFDWQTPENLGAGVNSSFDDSGPSYFANEEVGTPQLYFSSLRPGGPISRVYVSEQAADGSFGPALLIPELGVTVGGGVTPSIRHDGLEIFLASNRPGSLGFADLWVSTRETVLDAWSEPVNLGPPVNSTFVENLPDISSDGETLFFVSNRLGLGLAPDLYMSTRTKLSQK